MTAYGVLSRGLLSGSRSTGDTDFRSIAPRFQGDDLAGNLELVENLRKVAERIGSSTTQLAIAWVLAQGKDIVPVIGARRSSHLTEVFASCKLNLTADDIAAVETAIPKNAVHGSRYPEAFLAHLDRER